MPNSHYLKHIEVSFKNEQGAWSANDKFEELQNI